MTYVTLANPDVALFADVAGTRVVLPRMTSQARTRRYDRARTRFWGDEYDTELRGEGRGRSYPLVTRFFRDEQATMLALLDLFDLAHTEDDGRLQVRTNAADVAGLAPLEVVTLDGDPQETLVPGSNLAWDVSWTVTTVQFTLEV